MNWVGKTFSVSASLAGVPGNASVVSAEKKNNWNPSFVRIWTKLVLHQIFQLKIYEFKILVDCVENLIQNIFILDQYWVFYESEQMFPSCCHHNIIISPSTKFQQSVNGSDNMMAAAQYSRDLIIQTWLSHPKQFPSHYNYMPPTGPPGYWFGVQNILLSCPIGAEDNL